MKYAIQLLFAALAVFVTVLMAASFVTAQWQFDVMAWSETARAGLLFLLVLVPPAILNAIESFK